MDGDMPPLLEQLKSERAEVHSRAQRAESPPLLKNKE